MRTVIKLDHVLSFRKEKYMESLGIMEVGKQY